MTSQSHSMTHFQLEMVNTFSCFIIKKDFVCSESSIGNRHASGGMSAGLGAIS